MYILITIREFSYQNFQFDSFIYVNDPTRLLFLFSCLLTVAMLPARLTCSIGVDDILCVYATLTRAPYFFFFCRYVATLEMSTSLTLPLKRFSFDRSVRGDDLHDDSR